MEGDAPRVVCPRILVDGVSVIESTLASSEAYLLPEIIGVEIQTKLSACSVSSSVCAETGAPDIRHLTTLSTTDEEDWPQLSDASVCSTTGSDEDQCPHLLSSLNQDRSDDMSCSEKVIIAAENRDRRPQRLQLSQNGDAVRDRSRWEDNTPSSALLHVKFIQSADDGSVEVLDVASSITLSESFSVRPRAFHFSHSLMPEATPRSRYRARCNERQRSNNLSVVAPTPGRYQRPIDSLLTSNRNPSPVPKNARLKHRPRPVVPSPLNLNPQVNVYHKQSSNSSHLSGLTCENFDPQSPRVRVLAESKRTATPKNALKVRCDYSAY
eukprot:CAMPEP_0172328938 /NCGR_PEP_ID=MMETSP1058-20130122/60616_1 /TAXON_ID=83371 /ORGANISM="Detonula confervacea, Strain CCMP 353" /LENGTH=324 /DNA_ID=CAMNT_0013046077 /DNA_START=911 /DNA_END=1885 /DNA_ORIENTATION=+